jgi:polyhydroxybutyrate depolymerase
MHGYTMSGQAMFDVTDAAKLADTEHFAIAFPDGQGGPDSQGAPWNVGSNVCPSYAGAPPVATGDDNAFIDAMTADIADDQCLDGDHEFMTGFSMGGYMSHHANCMRDDIRAAAPASGGTHDLASCAQGHKPIIIFHGASDPLIPAGCNDPDATLVNGVTPAATAWAIHNGCNSTQTVEMSVHNGTCRAFKDCPADGQVTICTFANMGHCWAGGPSSAGVFACPDYEPATQLAWSFFKQHAW